MSKRYNPAEVTASVHCFAPDWLPDSEVRNTLVYDREGINIEFRLPQNQEYTIETSLWGLIELYARIDTNTPGYIPVHGGGYIRIKSQTTDDVQLDLSEWTRPATDSAWRRYREGPSIAGDKDAVLTIIESLIRDVVDVLQGYGTNIIRLRNDFMSDFDSELHGTRLWASL